MLPSNNANTLDKIISVNLKYQILYPPNTFVKKKMNNKYIPITAQFPRLKYGAIPDTPMFQFA